MAERPTFTGVHLFVRDLAAARVFYRRIGLDVPDGGDEFASIALPNGQSIALGTHELTRRYDSGFREPERGGACALQFNLASEQVVDDVYADLTGAGYAGHLAPFDAFWGARYAEVRDPDGNLVGFHGPRNPSRGGPPPE